jgi:hypothetical protein
MASKYHGATKTGGGAHKPLPKGHPKTMTGCKMDKDKD